MPDSAGTCIRLKEVRYRHMAGNTSPALARRQLRFALRRARDHAGLTQGQVADALEWSISKVNRIETGDVTVSATDLKALLQLLQITEPDVVEQYTARARASRRQGWWDQPEYKPHLTKATRQLIEFEGIASTIWSYQPITVPGILQTEAFANEIIAAFGNRNTPDARSAKVAIRMQRLQHVLDRPDPPEYRLLLDESVAIREVGGPKATADQFDHILALADSRRISFRIVPLRDGLQYAMAGSFTVFTLDVRGGALTLQRNGKRGRDRRAP